MGEISKNIGEFGEAEVESFLKQIGWTDVLKGLNIPCIDQNNIHLNQKGNQSRTHGIDFHYVYSSPFVPGHKSSILISSKYQTIQYPTSPASKFKEFITDLTKAMECYEYSEIKADIYNNMTYNSQSDIGVLFWLNNKNKKDEDLIYMISNSRIDAPIDTCIYIVDNKRFNFILDIIRCLKIQGSKFDYCFYYPQTGQNINPLNRYNTGKILPVEYLNSSIIPIRLENRDNSKEVFLFMGILDPFDKDEFIRIMGLAKDISASLTGQIIIAFSDYDQLTHGQQVQIAKSKFQDSSFTETVSVINYLKHFDIL